MSYINVLDRSSIVRTPISEHFENKVVLYGINGRL